MTAPISAETLIRRETAVSVAINIVLSLLFFLLVFGTRGPVPVWGVGGHVFDLVPQTFMIALMATLVPGFLTARRVAAGAVRASGGRSVLPANRLLRALCLAIAAAAIVVALGALLFSATAQAAIAWVPALVSKLAVGGLVATVVTPLGLRAELAARTPAAV